MRRNQVPDPVVSVVDERQRFLCPIEDCPHEKASKEGYTSHRSYSRHFDAYHLQSETVGFMSRGDWGSPGFRQGYLNLEWQIFEQERVRFIIWAGGLVSFPHLRGEMSPTNLRMVARDNNLYTVTQGGKKIEDSTRAREFLLDTWTAELSKAIPKIRRKTGYVKIYIVTSPAPNYDGWIGKEVALRLAKVRPDIFYRGERSARFPLKHQNKTIGVLVPMKASWRSKYFSAAVDRLIEDEEKQTSHELPDLWVVGCTASSLQRPAGEKKRPYISIPASHSLQEVHTAENQIGTRFAEFFPQEDSFLARNYSFKDYDANELQWIPDPQTEDELQKQAVAALKVQEEMTIGMLEDALKVGRTRIAEAIKALNSSGYEPRILRDEASQLYKFDLNWIQNSLSYPAIKLDGLREDAVLAFGCLHAGSKYSEYEFFVNEVPKLALKHGVKVLIGAGDFVEGTEHNLIERGEVMGGFNNTDQEILAAKEVCTVMARIFKPLFEQLINGRKRKLSGAALREAIDASLVKFIYAVGNHDAWIAKRAVTPLTTFHMTLVRCLNDQISAILVSLDLEPPDMMDLVEAKIVREEVSRLPSGLEIMVIHPFMARAMTSSLRAQHTLDMANTPVVVLANFHVAVGVEQWDADFGQRLAMQVGSIVWMTEFEHSKLKRLDVGVGYFRILSNEAGRILVTETAFFGGGERKVYDNADLRESFMGKIGI